MSDLLAERLNKVLPTLCSTDFLDGRGIGNEMAFYIFDYPPERELFVREFVYALPSQLAQKKPSLRVKHLNLFDFVIDYLKSRKLLDRALAMQQTKGDAAVRKALEAPLHENKLAPYFLEVVQPDKLDLVLLSGMGSVWPLVRAHTLLNNLHTVMNRTPLVLFYPGSYDGQTLHLFNKLKGKKYYRAFRLVP